MTEAKAHFWGRRAATITTQQQWEEAVFGWLLDGQVTYDELRELCPLDYPGEPLAELLERFYCRFTDEELESLPRALGQKFHARPLELLELEVSGLNCGGEDLEVVPYDVILSRIEATIRARGRGATSKWLNDYAVQLVNESRRRRGNGG